MNLNTLNNTRINVRVFLKVGTADGTTTTSRYIPARGKKNIKSSLAKALLL